MTFDSFKELMRFSDASFSVKVEDSRHTFYATATNPTNTYSNIKNNLKDIITIAGWPNNYFC